MSEVERGTQVVAVPINPKSDGWEQLNIFGKPVLDPADSIPREATDGS